MCLLEDAVSLKGCLRLLGAFPMLGSLGRTEGVSSDLLLDTLSGVCGKEVGCASLPFPFLAKAILRLII